MKDNFEILNNVDMDLDRYEDLNIDKDGDGKIDVDSMIKFHADDRVVICKTIDVLGRSFSNENQAILAYENGEIIGTKLPSDVRETTYFDI